jgi:hypothetical protein
MTIKFPAKGVHDNKPTPKTLYDIITQELKFIDVCLDRSKFNAVVKLWPDHSYCNPPFSKKKLFILRAVASHKILHSEVLLYLPFDSTTSWFKTLYQNNVLIMVFMKRMWHAKFPHALYHLKNYSETKVVLLQKESDILKLLHAARCPDNGC